MIVCTTFFIFVSIHSKIPYKSKIEQRTEIATIFMESMNGF